MTRHLRELVLWAGAALGLLAVACGVAVTWFGFSFLVFRSGSMSPEIPTGALALSRTVDAADIESGDVVSVVAANGDRITHRVVSTTMRGDEASLVLRGDANEVPDSEVYAVREAGRVVAAAPYAGVVVAHLLTPAGIVALACLSGMLLILSTGPQPVPAARRTQGSHRAPPGRRAGRPRVVLTVATMLALGALLVPSTVRGTWAAFTDPAGLSGTYSARTLDPPTGVACSTTGGTYIRWTAPTGPVPTGYRVHYTASPGGPGTADVGAGVTQWRPPAPPPFTSVSYTVRVSALRGSWSSVQSTTSDTITVSSIFVTFWSC